MSTLEICVALLRGSHVAAVVSLFGTLVFLAVVAPAAMAEAPSEAARLRSMLLRLARISGACGLIVGIVWLTIKSAVIAGADSASMTLQAVPVVALQTQFGQWLLVRFGLLIAVFAALMVRHGDSLRVPCWPASPSRCSRCSAMPAPSAAASEMS